MLQFAIRNCINLYETLRQRVVATTRFTKDPVKLITFFSSCACGSICACLLQSQVIQHKRDGMLNSYAALQKSWDCLYS